MTYQGMNFCCFGTFIYKLVHSVSSSSFLSCFNDNLQKILHLKLMLMLFNRFLFVGIFALTGQSHFFIAELLNLSLDRTVSSCPEVFHGRYLALTQRFVGT